MFSGNPLILVLGGISVLIFFTFLRTRASKKQMNRNNRVDYSRYWSKNKEKKKEENIIDGIAEEVKDDKSE
jgi:peroxiredoxin family protein